FDTWLVAGDWRRYFRTSLRSAVAVRALGYYAGGDRSRPINIGGPWALRGYPIYGYVAGTSAWLVNTEWRFPITDFLSIGFPFGVARFPGVQGALFSDVGRAWSAATTQRGTLGSAGLGLRFQFRYEGRRRRWGGRGTARVAPPDSLRFDYAGALGLGVGAAVVVGDSALWADPEENFRSLVPAVRMLWAALGVVRPPDAGARVRGGAAPPRTLWPSAARRHTP